MKKLLSIIVLGLLLIGSAYADSRKLLPNDRDVFSGEQFKENTHGKENKRYPKHAWEIVNKKDGYPVRAGERSIKIQVRAGDCYTRHDCNTNRERIEFTTKHKSRGEWWYAWSIYFPKDHKNLAPIGTMMVQFKQDRKYGNSFDSPPYWSFENSVANGGNRIVEGYWINNQVKVPAGAISRILTDEEILGKWNDILVNVNWTKGENGFFKVWVNDKLKFNYTGPTKRNAPVRFKFGLYRYLVFNDNAPTQTIFYDEIRIGKSKQEVTKYLD
jgi:hypothetical protein